MQDKGNPCFTFTITVQRIDCKVMVKNANEIKEGGDDLITQDTYRIVLSRHDDPDIEVTGHYWEIVEFNKIGQVQQIV